MTEHRNGLSNKELLIRVLDEVEDVRRKLDQKADRIDVREIREAVRKDALDARTRADAALEVANAGIRKKVGRAELFGWLSFAGLIAGWLVSVV